MKDAKPKITIHFLAFNEPYIPSMKKLRQSSRMRLILAGSIAGLLPSVCFFILYSSLPLIFKWAALSVSSTCLVFFPTYLWLTERTIKKRTHKARLLFFGISLISFILAFADLGQFVFGSHTIKVSDFDFYMGDISFLSILTNFAFAGFFSLLERGLDLHEKQDLKL
jgi:hypothetical protein